MGEKRKVLKCFGCKNEFLREELISYSSPGTVVMHNFCKSCYEERLERDRFSYAVCRIFGIKSPGPIIWTQRKRLMKNGFTDQMIIECLEYLYDTKKVKKYIESLGLVTYQLYEEMKAYKEWKQKSMPSFDAARLQEQASFVYVMPRENTEKEKEDLDPNDFLNE